MKFQLEHNFAVENIEGETYILPYGQNIAMHKKGIKLNATGEHLWNLMEKTCDYEEILHSFYHYYDAYTKEEKLKLQTDLDDFLNTLRAHRIIRVTDLEKESEAGQPFLTAIGGLGISLHLPKDYIHPNFKAFATEELPKHFISVYLESFSNYGMSDGTVLVRTDELIILQKENQYIFDYKDNTCVKELIYDYAEKIAYIHLVENENLEKVREEIFFGIRNAFLIYASKHNRFAIHSASFLYDEKVWLVSAHSGGGKSTHVNLWKEKFEVQDFNGDLNLVMIENNIPVVCGLPWCGTSGIYKTGQYPLGGIIFLSQGEKEEFLAFEKGEKPLYIMQRMISPGWTKEMMEKNLDMGKRLAGSDIGLWKLSCTKNYSAAEFMKKEIDQWNS